MKILDCTLRDGGYYTDWHFDNELVRRLPASQLWFLKDEINGMGRAFAGGRY